MKVEWRPLSEVRPYERNPRRNEAAVGKVAGSIRAYGWRQPIVVDQAGVIIAGHTRLLAAKQLGLDKVPVHVATDLTPAQVKAYRLADNRVAQEAEWDDALLRLELADLDALGEPVGPLGFTDEELAALRQEVVGLLDGADPDDAPEPPAVPVTTPGQVITLGSHRLVCGDATDPTAWQTLLGGERVDAVWTDPPYGVSYADKNEMLNAADKGNRVQTPIENDHISEADLAILLAKAFGLAAEHSKPGAAWYVASPAGPLFHVFGHALKELGVWRHTLTWVKDGMVLGRCDYHYRHEPLFYGWTPHGPHSWHGGRSQDTVLEFPRPKRSALHPTMKPVGLVQRCIENNTTPGQIVADPFGGSGTTLMAAQASGRSARLIELSPHYCDVIVQRWEEATGGRATRR